MDIAIIVSEITLKNPDISEITLKEFPQRAILQDRLILEIEEQITIDNALKVRNDHKFPFWESLLSTYIDGSNYSSKLLAEVIYHNKFVKKLVINKSEFEDIEQILSENQHRRFALSSKIKTINNKYMHIPMLDFHIPMNRTFPNILLEIIDLLGQKNGFFLESGESYHYYGTELMTCQELLKFLGKALRFSPIIDRAWISHQIEEKSCALRVGFKNGILPKIVKQIG
jgi:hypothetical protein